MSLKMSKEMDKQLKADSTAFLLNTIIRGQTIVAIERTPHNFTLHLKMENQESGLFDVTGRVSRVLGVKWNGKTGTIHGDLHLIIANLGLYLFENHQALHVVKI